MRCDDVLTSRDRIAAGYQCLGAGAQRGIAPIWSRLVKSPLALAGLVLIGLLLPACAKPEDTRAAPTVPSVAPDGTALIDITGDDEMTFNITGFVVAPGQRVRLTLTNVGKMPFETMGHNLVILKQGEETMRFASLVGRNKGDLSNDYLPTVLHERVIAHTRLLGPGQSQSIEFTAPSEIGDYPYLCTFPSHFMTMYGAMSVKAPSAGE